MIKIPPDDDFTETKQFFGILVIFVLVFLICALYVMYHFGRTLDQSTPSWIVGACSIATAFCGILTAVFFYLQFEKVRKQSKENLNYNEAELALRLYSEFNRNPDISEVYRILEHPDIDFNGEDPRDRMRITTYLTFFETLFYLIEKKRITIRAADHLFGYRFFLAMHDKKIQEIKFTSGDRSYANLFKLYVLWAAYRRKFRPEMGLEPSPNNTVEKLEDYKELIKEGNDEFSPALFLYTLHKHDDRVEREENELMVEMENYYQKNPEKRFRV
jgi:hypothetical protein